jgi:hypothetical protein
LLPFAKRPPAPESYDLRTGDFEAVPSQRREYAVAIPPPAAVPVFHRGREPHDYGFAPSPRRAHPQSYGPSHDARHGHGHPQSYPPGHARSYPPSHAQSYPPGHAQSYPPRQAQSRDRGYDDHYSSNVKLAPEVRREARALSAPPAPHSLAPVAFGAVATGSHPRATSTVLVRERPNLRWGLSILAIGALFGGMLGVFMRTQQNSQLAEAEAARGAAAAYVVASPAAPAAAPSAPAEALAAQPPVAAQPSAPPVQLRAEATAVAPTNAPAPSAPVTVSAPMVIERQTPVVVAPAPAPKAAPAPAAKVAASKPRGRRFAAPPARPQPPRVVVATKVPAPKTPPAAKAPPAQKSVEKAKPKVADEAPKAAAHDKSADDLLQEAIRNTSNTL